MKINKKLLTAVGIVLGVALVAGVTAIAATTYGSSSDPLVTLSYLNEDFTAEIMDSVGAMVENEANELTAALDAKIAQITGSSTAPGGDSEAFILVALKSGQKLTCGVGSEILLRIGTASCYASASPGLVDETTGGTLDSGSALSANHMYLVTIEGHGLKATAASVKVLVRGSYTIE